MTGSAPVLCRQPQAQDDTPAAGAVQAGVQKLRDAHMSDYTITD